MEEYCIYCMRPSKEETCPHCGKRRSDYTAAAHQLPAGSILHDKYYIGAVLGEGGFGITYVGRDLTLDMKVAVKEYFPNGIVNRNNTVSQELTQSVTDAAARFDKGKRDFLTEARTLAKFAAEQHCVSVRDFFEENNTAYIVMEYLEGMDLREYLDQNSKFSFDEMFRLLEPVMQVLGKVHEKGLIHRDISPANIMVLASGEAKLLDFGAARDVSGDNEKSLSILLKPGYAPEEQYRTKGKQGPWTDIYALSATIYKILTGVTPEDSMNRVFEDELKPITELNPTVTKAQEAAILKGMAVRHEERYQNVDKMIAAFRAAAAAPAPAKPAPAPRPAPAPARPAPAKPAPVMEEEGGAAVQAAPAPEERPVQAAPAAEQPAPAAAETAPPPTPAPALAPTQAPMKPSAAALASVPMEKGGKKKFRLAAVGGVVAFVAILGVAIGLGQVTKKPAASKPGTSVSQNKVDKEDKVEDVGNGALEFKAKDTRIEWSGKNVTVTDLKNLKRCTNLKALELENCNLTDEHIKVIAELMDHHTSLNELELSDNAKITDISPLFETERKNKLYLEIKNCTGIQDLSMINKDNTNILDVSGMPAEVVTTISGSVWHFKAVGCGLTDLSFLKDNIGELDDLRVGKNQISDISVLADAQNLHYFYADYNEISDLTPLADHVALYQVGLSNNKLTDITPLKDCYKVYSLDLSYNEIEDITALSTITELWNVGLHHNKIKSLAPLASCEKFLEQTRSLDVRYNALTDCTGLEECYDLEQLYLSHNALEDVSALADLNLHILHLNDNKLTGEAVGKLHFTDDAQTVELLDNPIETLSQIGGSVKNLYITDNVNIDYEECDFLASNLYVYGCETNRRASELREEYKFVHTIDMSMEEHYADENYRIFEHYD